MNVGSSKLILMRLISDKSSTVANNNKKVNNKTTNDKSDKMLAVRRQKVIDLGKIHRMTRLKLILKMNARNLVSVCVIGVKIRN